MQSPLGKQLGGRTLKPLLIGPALALGLVGGMAQAASWECNFGGQKADGWLRGQVFLTDATEGKPATVYDSLINMLHSGPIEARVSADNDQRTTFKWRLRKVSLAGRLCEEHQLYSDSAEEQQRSDAFSPLLQGWMIIETAKEQTWFSAQEASAWRGDMLCLPRKRLVWIGAL